MVRRALFVGVDNYTGGIPALSCAQNDALELRNVFADLGYDAHVFRNAETHALLDKIDELTSDLTQDDLFLFFFAGHGYTDKNAQRRLACKGDTKFRIQIGADGIGLDELREITNPAGCRRIFILDACQVMVSSRRAGDGETCRDPFTKRDVEAVSRIAERSDDESCAPIIVINSCSTGEVAYEFDGHGLFTHALLDVVKSVCNSDAAFDRELVALVNEHMRKASKGCYSQTPQYYGEEENAIAIPLLPTAQDVIDTRASQHNNGEDVESLIDEREKLDWYEMLSVKDKVLRHVRTILASVFYISGYAFFMHGCGFKSKDGTGLMALLPVYAFFVTVFFWCVAMLLNSRNTKETIDEIKKWFAHLFKGKPIIDIPFCIGAFLRYFAGCYLVMAGMLSVSWIVVLVVWGALGFQRDFWVSLCVMFMALSGLGIGAYALGMKLMMRRKIYPSSPAARKWVMIIGAPLLLFLFFDRGAFERVQNLDAGKKAAKEAVKAFNDNRYAKAWNLIEKADTNDPTLCACIGDAYLHEYGVKYNPTEAIRWYLKAARTTEEGALQFNIGLCYYLITNYVESAKWMSAAVKNGDFDGCFYLGLYNECGAGGFKVDYEKASQFYKLAQRGERESTRKNAQAGLRRICNRK